MKIKILPSFSETLLNHIEFIAQDKVSAARKFKSDILSKIQAIQSFPYKHRKSIFFDDASIRDMVFKGYVIIYKINLEQGEIEVFSFLKYKELPDDFV